MRTTLSLFFAASVVLVGQSVFAETINYKSSIQTTYVHGPESKEEINTPRLKKLAKITEEKAKEIARSHFKGAVKKVELENEEGNVVWSVEIGKHEVAIDAGNGKILASE